jgi:uncharacterized protein YmfQ (DUF2313 family)
MRLRRTLIEHTQSLANYLPGGRVFAQKNKSGSNLRKLLRGLATEVLRADEFIRTYEQEVIPDQTTLFIDEWEQAVGIPDSCFKGTGTIEQRRTHVLIKLASLGVQTEQDFIDLAALFGVTVTIEQGSTQGAFPMTFPLLLLGDAAYFTIIVRYSDVSAARFPHTFPITFGAEAIGIMECLFTKLKPANCDLIFEQV